MRTRFAKAWVSSNAATRSQCPTKTTSNTAATPNYGTPIRQSSSSSSLDALPAAAASLLAGSVAGALGVGVAYPLDTIKSKAQVLATETSTTATVDSSGAAVALPSDGSMVQVARHIYHTAGIAGFFGGVQTSMMGQAVIKAVVFAINAAVLQFCQQHHILDDHTAAQLLLAAATAGFCTSFLAAPVDRIKKLMQCSHHECYGGNERQCLQAVLNQEGWRGLMGRGLACTMLREVPAYSLYFGVYGGLQAYCSDLTAALGPSLAPAVYGAAAGCACFVPVYPVDVVKTWIQNTEGCSAGNVDSEGNNSKSAWEVAVDMYQGHGIGVFWDGIAPRMLRQAVNHAVTFSVFDGLVHAISMS